jgi:uncharacterized protein YpuA (DUF1002 family)
MPIEIAGISLPRIHRIVTREKADFASHRIPGLEGNVVQDMGRHSVYLDIDGIFYGATAKDDMEALRDVYKAREPVDFLADVVGQAYFAQIIIETLEVRQAAEEPDQFSYRLTVVEYVPPPKPASGFETPDIDTDLGLEALDFMDMIQLPDLLSVPSFGDPTTPLASILDGVKGTLGGLDGPANDLSGLFGGGSGPSAVSARDVSVSGGGSIFDTLKSSVNDNQILQLIQGQLSTLTSAGKSSGDAHGQTSGGISSLTSSISNLLPPSIDRSDILQKGFDAVKGVLPTNASDILGDLPGGMDSLFATLKDNLVDGLGGILSSFDQLSDLGIGISAAGYNPITDQIALPNTNDDVPPAAAVGFSRGSRDVSAIVDPLNDLLALLPDPLDAKALLQLLSDQLNQFPRHLIPVQNLPILDEMRDKLNTVLGWLNADGTALSASLATSLQKLAAYIHTGIYDTSLTPVKNRMVTLRDAGNLVDLQNTIEAIKGGLSDLAAQIHSADLSHSEDTIATLGAQIGALRSNGQVVMATWVNGDGKQLVSDFSGLDDKLEERIADILLLGAPSTDIKLVGMLLSPLNNALAPQSIAAFTGGIHNLFKIVDNLIEKLNLTTIADKVQEVVDAATGAVHTLQNLIVNVTVEFTKLTNKVEDAINNIGISKVVDELKNILQQFEQTVVQGLNTVFAPVRNVLLTAFDTINNFVAAFDPKKILQAVLDLIKALTDVLSNPVLLDTIKKLKQVLGDVNNELGSFSFRSVTDVIIEGIGVVEDAFNIVAKIPMTDSIKQEVSKALNSIPKTIHPATDTINDGLEEIVENGAKPVLVAIKDAPAQLVVEVKKYSPDKYLGDKLSAPYQEFVNKLAELKPTTLMQPVTVELDKVLDKVRETVDPDKVFSLLQGPFDTLFHALDDLNPSALIQPLQDKLTEGIHVITDHLPLDAADAAFNKVKSITDIIRNAVDQAERVRDAMIAVNNRLEGLSTADEQLQHMGDDIVNKLNTVSDFTAISAALAQVEAAVDEIAAAQLQLFLVPTMDDLISKLTSLDPQNRLISLVQAQRGFPISALNALENSQAKSDILALLASFNPMADEFTQPLGGLQDRLADLQKARTDFLAFLTIWQNRYFQPNGPLNQYRQKNLTLAQLKTLLADTIRTQLVSTLTPAFQIIQKFQVMLSALLGEIITLVGDLEIQAEALVKIGDALETMRQDIHAVVDLLNHLDITFIAREIDQIFDAVKAQLDAINPSKISALLKTTFDHLLDALDPNTLFGLADLDDRHTTLVNLLRERDPKKLVTELVQPEFDKVLNFLKLLDISDLLTTFIQRIEDLKVQLGTELDRTADAYDGMIKAIPGELQGQIGISVSVTT